MGALDGVKVLELAGIGPGPFCGMMRATKTISGPLKLIQVFPCHSAQPSQGLFLLF